MFDYTYDNHFKFGYNGEYFNHRQSKIDRWNVTYGKSREVDEVFDFHDAMNYTARVIYNSTFKQINVLMSGGIDSEMVARSFLNIGIKPRITIGAFKGFHNLHDISHAVVFCQNHDLKYDLIEVDVIKNLSGNAAFLDFYAEHGKCFSPQLCTTMFLMDRAVGLPILGSAECLLEYDGTSWNMLEKERIASWYRFLIALNLEGVPGFFQYTPELMYRYLTHPLVTSMVHDCNITSSESIKFDVYNYKFKNLNRRLKFTGYETIQLKDKHARDLLKELYVEYDDVCYTEYNTLLEMVKPT